MFGRIIEAPTWLVRTTSNLLSVRLNKRYKARYIITLTSPGIFLIRYSQFQMTPINISKSVRYLDQRRMIRFDGKCSVYDMVKTVTFRSGKPYCFAMLLP